MCLRAELFSWRKSTQFLSTKTKVNIDSPSQIVRAMSSNVNTQITFIFLLFYLLLTLRLQYSSSTEPKISIRVDILKNILVQERKNLEQFENFLFRFLLLLTFEGVQTFGLHRLVVCASCPEASDFVAHEVGFPFGIALTNAAVKSEMGSRFTLKVRIVVFFFGHLSHVSYARSIFSLRNNCCCISRICFEELRKCF